MARPLGAVRTAAALATRTGHPVTPDHVQLLVEAGLLAVAGHYEGRPLYDRGQTAAVPAEAVAALPGMPPTPPGHQVVDFSHLLEQRYGLQVTVAYRARSGRWHLDWVPLPSGDPDPAALRADLSAHPAAAHRRLIDLATPAHRAIAAARRALTPGAAVILDTETTGLGADAVVIEIAAVEADTGRVLLDTLVHPGEVAVERGARAVHGIGDTDLETAPTWREVWPRLCEIATGRLLVGYHVDFDRRLIRQTARAHGLRPPSWDWACAMAWRGAATHTSRPGPLRGGHRALGDALAARDVVRAVAAMSYTVD